MISRRALMPAVSGFGSIIGRNSLQRKKPEVLKFRDTVMGIYAGTVKWPSPPAEPPP
jgi:hypothetical protein